MKIQKKPRKDPKDAEITKLKNRIRRLEKERNNLKTEVKTYEAAFRATEKYLKDFTEEFSVEELIDAAKEKKTLRKAKKAKHACPSCFSTNVTVKKLSFGDMVSCKDCNDVKVVKGEQKDKRKDN